MCLTLITFLLLQATPHMSGTPYPDTTTVTDGWTIFFYIGVTVVVGLLAWAWLTRNKAPKGLGGA